MKMADNTLMMTFQNNCESINSNCVEVSTSDINEKITNNDIITTTKMETIENEANGQERNEEEAFGNDSETVATAEDAGEKILAGDDDKAEEQFKPDLLDVSSNDGISFKNENDLILCDDDDEETDLVQREEELLEDEPTQEEQPEDHIEEKIVVTRKYRSRVSVATYIARNLTKRSFKCLNKMQIMEDVREGCDVQPSSPGHAEERNANDDIQESKTEIITENGYNNETLDSCEKQVENEDDEDGKVELETNEIKVEVDPDDIIKTEDQNEPNQFIEESYSNVGSPVDNQSNKRKIEQQQQQDESPSKRLRNEIQENYISRNRIINEFMELSDCNNIDQIQIQSEQILNEIRTLNELAKEKEREWNNIIHLKKIKEELLIRMQRKKQIIMMTEKNYDYADMLSDSMNDNNGLDEPTKSHQQSLLKTNLSNSARLNRNQMKGGKQRNILPKPQINCPETNGRQRPVLDVQSIIADYRQRHPEAVPRRGRRIRPSQSDNSKNSILTFSSMALGSGSQVRSNDSGDLGMYLNSINSNRPDGSNNDLMNQPHDTTSFKDMLVQFARLSQNERNELIQNAIKPPPPYPEVTVHPVPTTTAAPNSSLLHGILTKSPTKSSKASFSPTLARLLTAPERNINNNVAPSTTASIGNGINQANMSITEILCTNKTRNEITITPVSSQYDNKARTNVDEEAEDSADRLVIDESTEAVDGRKCGDNSSDAGDEVPQCQGCNQKPAQFVCAGCGNQWYCSRDCQVSAWDEHSEVCSG